MPESRRINITLRQDHECTLLSVTHECKLPMILLPDGCEKECIATSITTFHVTKVMLICSNEEETTSGIATAMEASTWLGLYYEMDLGYLLPPPPSELWWCFEAPDIVYPKIFELS